MRGIAGLWAPEVIAPDLVAAFRAAVGKSRVVHPGPGFLLAAGEGAMVAEADGVVAAATADLLPPPSNGAGDAMTMIVRAYAKGDPGLLQGHFAYACWSVRDGLELAVDRFRTRPLVYARIGDGIVFASRIDCLCQLPGVSAALDVNGLVDYLSFTVIPAPRTIFRDIRKLRAAHRIVCRDRVGEARRYWSLSYRAARGRTREEFASDLRGRLGESVGRCLSSDTGHVGCFLSGGLDSSTVVGFAAQRGECDAFSIGFNEARYDERPYADLVAGHFGARHHVRVVTPQDLAGSLERVVLGFDEPFGNSSAIAVYQCARLAKESGVEILLAGDGGDEIFAGNERYRTDFLFQQYERLPAPLRRVLLEPLAESDWFCGLPAVGKLGRYVRRARISNPDRVLSYGLYVDRNLDRVLQPDILAEVAGHRAASTARQLFMEGDGDSDLGRLLLFDHQLTLADNDLRKVTESCQLAGVTVRYPMLDQRVVELAGQIPASWLLAGGKLRAFYKESMADFLPRTVLQKRKHGFGLPFASWLRADAWLKQMVGDYLASSGTPLNSYVRSEFLFKLRDAHLAETEPYYADLLWPFLVLAIWLANQ
jgi:asparagine synthase (glutamine-hydrolysing)